MRLNILPITTTGHCLPDKCRLIPLAYSTDVTLITKSVPRVIFWIIPPLLLLVNELSLPFVLLIYTPFCSFFNPIYFLTYGILFCMSYAHRVTKTSFQHFLQNV